MPTIRIDYDIDMVEAVLSVEAPSRQWDTIVRVLREHSPDTRATSVLALRLPWWAFLGARKAVGYQVAQGNIALDASAAAVTALRHANEREQQLSEAATLPDVHELELNERLVTQRFRRPLKDFQARNLLRLCRLPVGATFSVPGAGKTTEALAFFAFHRQADSRLLVVAPKNAFAAWEEQWAICFPDDRTTFLRLIGGRSAIERTLSRNLPTLMLVTYEQFPTASSVIARYLGRFNSFMFLDESHRIKGGTARVRAAAVLNASPAAGHRLVMSGTPLPNAESDLLPQMRFLTPELEIRDDTVVERIGPFFVRTTKKDLALPEPTRIDVRIRMGEAQRQLYELLRSELARDARQVLSRDLRKAMRRIGRSATRLLQYVSNPSLLIGKLPLLDEHLGAVIEEGDSPKLEWACRRARQLARSNEKVIIWSSFVQNVEIISDRLADLGADFIHGGVEASSEAEADSREAKIKRFHDDKNAMVLVANPAACGEGISLHTVCDHAIYVDRSYNAAQYIQSEDRIHRIGSDAQKFVEILTCPDSIDESVARRLQVKTQRMAEVLNDPGLRIDPISLDPDQIDLDADDIIDLLRHLRPAEDLAA